jgi:hypothetical protein
MTAASWTSIIDQARKKFDAYKEHVTESNHKVTAEAFHSIQSNAC